MSFEDSKNLEIYGARMHNLKNIDLNIPRDQLVVITGLSGSGKSSLAFDTIYAEGQRRYMETFSAYARQFIGNMERPDVDEIRGLSPVISIEQKTASKNPRSTVGTITEIYDFLRLLFARVADAYSYETGKKMVKYSESQILEQILKIYSGKTITLLAPLVKGRKGHYRDFFEQIRRQGFLKARIDGVVSEIKFGHQLDRYKVHDIEVVIDKLKISNENIKRITNDIQTAFRLGKGMMLALENETEKIHYFSRMLMCADTGIAYPEPEPNTFSFNSPYGACSKCNGLGEISEVDLSKIIPDFKKSINNGGLAPVGSYKNNWIFKQIEALAHRYNFSLNDPIGEIQDDALNAILYGTDEILKIKNDFLGVTSTYNLNFDGIINFIVNQSIDSSSKGIQKWANNFTNVITCPECLGGRLKKESLQFKIGNKNIAQLSAMDLCELEQWIRSINNYLDERKQIIAGEIVKELLTRLGFLLSVGVDYLSLNRSSKSLSGGESQRIRLATQIGSKLVGVLYILDEPSIGLHQRDNQKLISALKELRDIGNSVIVVEHDKEMILSSDFVVDIGPGAGINGGKIVATGTPDKMRECDTITCKYLNGDKFLKIPSERRKPNGKFLVLKGAKGNNLKNVNLNVPLGVMICVTGVSGSGKSSLINDTLHPILQRHFYRSTSSPLPYDSIDGIKNIDKVIEIDQTPIGRTPRSNPATYVGVFDEIRKLYASLPDSKIRGYSPGRFSFNVKGGRCETCGGAGIRTIEMNFLPDVYVACEDCNGKRYNRETLEIRYKGKSINDVLNMDIKQAMSFFENIPSIVQKIKTLNDVGLGYLTLGQQSTTLSGGEAQRVKLATELSKKDSGNTLYMLDEPTTGLHFEDIRVLIDVLNKLVDKGNTVIIIEHNLDVIKVADYIIDIGPEGGLKGGFIVAEGTPEEICKTNIGYTAQYLKKELKIV